MVAASTVNALCLTSSLFLSVSLSGADTTLTNKTYLETIQTPPPTSYPYTEWCIIQALLYCTVLYWIWQTLCHRCMTAIAYFRYDGLLTTNIAVEIKDVLVRLCTVHLCFFCCEIKWWWQNHRQLKSLLHQRLMWFISGSYYSIIGKLTIILIILYTCSCFLLHASCFSCVLQVLQNC